MQTERVGRESSQNQKHSTSTGENSLGTLLLHILQARPWHFCCACAIYYNFIRKKLFDLCNSFIINILRIYKILRLD